MIDIKPARLWLECHLYLACRGLTEFTGYYYLKDLAITMIQIRRSLALPWSSELSYISSTKAISNVKCLSWDTVKTSKMCRGSSQHPITLISQVMRLYILIEQLKSLFVLKFYNFWSIIYSSLLGVGATANPSIL